eukprot:g5384.t1
MQLPAGPSIFAVTEASLSAKENSLGHLLCRLRDLQLRVLRCWGEVSFVQNLLQCILCDIAFGPAGSTEGSGRKFVGFRSPALEVEVSTAAPRPGESTRVPTTGMQLVSFALQCLQKLMALMLSPAGLAPGAEEMEFSEPPAELEEYEQTLLIEKRVTDLTEKCSDFIGAKQGYHIERCIGRGHFGEAFLVRDPSGRRRVLKALELERASLAPPRREAELMQKLRHVHIVRFRDCFEEKGFLGIVMDYARSGDLLALVDRAKETEQPLPEDRRAQSGAVRILAFTSGSGGPMANTGTPGHPIYARLVGIFVEQQIVGTPLYLSPEICAKGMYSTASDLWALGCALFELLTLSLPFEAANLPALLVKIAGTSAPRPASACQELADLCAWLLTKSRMSRPSAAEAGFGALGADVVSTWAPGRLLFNSYGPTEISVVCTGIDVQVGDPITLGPALPGYECHILDPNTLAMKELGEVGILFVGGVGLARGYLGEEGKTNEKFIELPGLGRLFNTGDLAFKDQENRLHYRGRVDSQVKVRGLRIELEALESAIMDLGTVKHCEARVLEGRLVLLASLASGSLCSEELKAKAMSLGRGYVLSQVKVVDDTAWKFSSGGKLLRNVVPWGDLEKTAGDAFDRVGASALELEIAACVARVVGPLESWDRNSHFVDDLGIDSAGMGQLLGQIRGTKHRQKADLRALFEHPTVSALALFLSDPESDSEEENLDSEQGSKNLVGTIWKSMQANPHNICCELPCSCLSYMQLFRLATAFQRQLRRDSTTTGCRGPVAICLDMMTERMAAMLAVLMEGRAFCVLDEGHGFADQLQVFNAQCILASSKDAVWASLQEICQDTQEICCIDVSSVGCLA